MARWSSTGLNRRRKAHLVGLFIKKHTRCYLCPNTCRFSTGALIGVFSGYGSVEEGARTARLGLDYSSDAEELGGGRSSSFDDAADEFDRGNGRRREPAWVQRLKALAVVSRTHPHTPVGSFPPAIEEEKFR